MDRAVSKDDLKHKASPTSASPPIAKTLKISGVELKIVGESLSIIKEYKERLDLVCVAEGDSCRINFKKGGAQSTKLIFKFSLC